MVLVNHHAKRWTIEPALRNTKDLQFGMALSATRIGEPTKRDRLLLVSTFAMAVLMRRTGAWLRRPIDPAQVFTSGQSDCESGRKASSAGVTAICFSRSHSALLSAGDFTS